MSSGKIVLGFLAGAAAGAVLGILFAPDKGLSTRKKISKKSKDYVNGVGDKFTDLVNAITKKIEGLKEEASQLMENGKAKVEEVVTKEALSKH